MFNQQNRPAFRPVGNFGVNNINNQHGLNFNGLFGGGGYNFNNVSDMEDSQSSQQEDDVAEEIPCYECTAPGPDGHQCDNTANDINSNHYKCHSCNRWHPVREVFDRPNRCLICENTFCS